MAHYGSFKYSQAPYGLRSRVYKTLTLVYNIFGWITKELTLIYNLFKPVSVNKIADNYSQINVNTIGVEIIEVGQSFTGNGGILNSCKFYLKRTGSDTGNIVAKIYTETHATAFGTDSVPNGSALAISDNVDISTISSSFSLISFTFSGENKILLTNGTKYIVTLLPPVSSTVAIGVDSSSPTHSGNYCDYSDGIWLGYSTYDCCFYIYEDTPLTFTIKYNLFNPVNKTLALIYNLFTETYQTIIAKYNLYASLTKTLTQIYNLYGSTTKTLILKYNLFSKITKTFTLVYNLFSSINQTLTLKYNIFNPVTKTLSLIYNLIGRVYKTLTLKYHLRSRTGLWFAPISKTTAPTLTKITKPTTNFNKVSKPATIWTEVEESER